MEAYLRYKKDLDSSNIQGSLGKNKIKNQKKTIKKNIEEIEEIEIEEKKEIKNIPRIDFIQRNINMASKQSPRSKIKKNEPEDFSKKHKPGIIPKYIEERKIDIKLENPPPPDVKCPKGMRILAQEEKQETLDNLINRKLEIESQLSRAPLRIESPQLLRHKKLLEQEVSDIEKSISQLSKKYVFVPE